MVQKITPAAARRMMETGEAVPVDVREPSEYAAGHIPGARLLPLGSVRIKAADVIPDQEAAWLIYCRSGQRSAMAAAQLEAMGYHNLYDLGGIMAWPYEVER